MDGSERVRPVVRECTLTSSGDDAINITGACRPAFLQCAAQGKVCSLEALDTSKPELQRCSFEGGEGQGIRADCTSQVTLTDCSIKGNKEDGIVAMGNADVSMFSCQIASNSGAGIDGSGSARVTASACTICDNGAGVMLWDSSCGHFCDSNITAGPDASLAFLVDAGVPSPLMRNCHFEGFIHGSDEVLAQVEEGMNRHDGYDRASSNSLFPPAKPPFNVRE